MKVDYKAKKFVKHIYGRKLFGEKTLEFSESELVYSTIMVGKDSFMDYIRLGITGELEIKYRIYLLFSLIQENISNRLVKSSNYKDTFDPTEKAFASYYLGNVFTKLVSTKLLNINKLLHFDLYKSTVSVNTIGNRRPDFIGRNHKNEWILAESKGRSKLYDNEATISGKDQLVGIYSINNSKPSLRYVVQTYFERDILKLHIEDPEGNKSEFMRMSIDEDLFERTYYNLILNVLSENIIKLKLISIKEGDFYYYCLKDIDIGIGLRKDIYNKYIKNKDHEEVMMKIDGSNFTLYKKTDYFVANDGVLVVCNSKLIKSEFK